MSRHCDPCNSEFCCQVRECMNIHSSDNSITVTKEDCGVDLTLTGNNIGNVIKINDGECITWVREYINGALVFTPQINWACVAANVCGLCPESCPAVTDLIVTIISED